MMGKKINSGQWTKTFNLCCQWGWRLIVYNYDSWTATNPHNPLYVLHRWYWIPQLYTWHLRIGCCPTVMARPWHIMLLFFSIPLCSAVMPIMLLKLSHYSQIMLKNFLVHRQNTSFSMYVHALNRDPCVIITFSHGEGFNASLLFPLA